MTKTIGIHQPNFLPWLGYFFKIKKSDVFIYLDTVQYTKNSYQNRNKIKTPQGEQWLAVPVLTKGKFGQATHEVEINPQEKWKDKILKTLEMNYKKAPFFTAYFEKFKALLEKNTSSKLAAICIELIEWTCQELAINTPRQKASELNIPPELKSTDMLVEICKRSGADTYLSGSGGQHYQEEEKFKQANIGLAYSSFKYPEYEQLWKEFVPNLSIIDTLFNCGPKTKDLLTA